MANPCSLQFNVLHALSVLSLPFLHQSLICNGSQRRKFFSSCPHWLATVSQLLMAATPAHCLPPSRICPPLASTDCVQIHSQSRLNPWSVKLLLAFASSHCWLESPLNPWPIFILSPIHVRVSKWRLLFGLSAQVLRLLHSSFSTTISALSRRPGHYGICASFVTAFY
jgi:hypothetical protein